MIAAKRTQEQESKYWLERWLQGAIASPAAPELYGADIKHYIFQCQQFLNGDISVYQISRNNFHTVIYMAGNFPEMVKTINVDAISIDDYKALLNLSQHTHLHNG